MTLALSAAAGERRQGRRLRLDRQHVRVGRRVRRQGRAADDRAAARRPDRDRQARAGDRARGQGRAGRRQLRRLPRAGPQALARLPGGPGQLGQPDPHRGPEDGGVRDRRRRSATRRDLHVLPVGNAGQHHRLLARLHPVPRRRATPPGPRGCGASRPPGAAPLVLGHPVLDPETVATAIRIGNPASADQAIAARDESGGLIDLVTDEQILAAQSFLAATRGHLRRAGVGRRRRRACWPSAARASSRRASRSSSR